MYKTNSVGIERALEAIKIRGLIYKPMNIQWQHWVAVGAPRKDLPLTTHVQQHKFIILEAKQESSGLCVFGTNLTWKHIV